VTLEQTMTQGWQNGRPRSEPNEQFGEQEFHEIILIKDCVDLTIGFLCDLVEVLSGHHSATKSAAQPETAMSPMGHRCASDWPARKDQITALRLLPDQSRLRGQSSCMVTRPRQPTLKRACPSRPGRPALRPSRPGAGKSASLGWRSRHLRPIADQGHPCAGQGSRPGF
jgi:hypothetical protein